MDWRMGAAAILVAVLIGSAFLPNPGGDMPEPNPEPEDERISDPLSAVRSELLALHNEARRKSGAEPLVLDDGLNAFAQSHAEWMSRFGMIHSRMKFSGFNRKGENIAMGYQTASVATSKWMRSSGHRRNIISLRFTHVGFGLAESSSGTPYWCAVFGGK